MTSYAVVLPADENWMNTETMWVDNTEQGQWDMVDN